MLAFQEAVLNVLEACVLSLKTELKGLSVEAGAFLFFLSG